MRWYLVFFLILLAANVRAGSVVPTKTLRANTIIQFSDVTISQDNKADGFSDIAQVVGKESRVVLYAGRLIRPEDIGPPAVIKRNQLVPMKFNHSGLEITAVGRALDRGAVGDLIRLMNVSSRKTLFGVVSQGGVVNVHSK